ncbi:helix-turn-helix domain-containing protein [Kitasatospora sp. NPDC089797]|uniref:helix-turn-helix domain-containing protein n=1 Tax=Kitasatospora sp. NPDC089797 TaxID=3155298 RepID=UPI003431D5E5
MEQLLERLSALDPGAESAVRAIAYFDALLAGRAGLDPFVRAAAVLTGRPAGLHDPDRHLQLRIHPDGHRLDPTPFTPGWPTVLLRDTSDGRVWIEREEPAGELDSLVLERLAVGVGVVLDRTRGRAPAFDPAAVELLLGTEADSAIRRRTAHRLALPVDQPLRVLATLDEPTGEPTTALRRWRARIGRVTAAVVPGTTGWATVGRARAGLGPVVTLDELPVSWAGSLAALRLTAEGTAAEPGPRQLRHDELGGLTVLTERLSPDEALVPDVRALREAERQMPGALATLDALAEYGSLRQAAAALRVHHSTLQARLPQLTAALGFPPETAPGRSRLHLALALHRLHRNGRLP